MRTQVWSLGVAGILAAVTVAAPAGAQDAATLDAPAEAQASSTVMVKFTGPKGRFDRLGIVKAGAPDGARLNPSEYAKLRNPAELLAPAQPGDYELRYVAAKPDRVLARRKIKIVPVTATVEAPSTAVGGATIEVAWKGPGNRFDRLIVVPAGASDKRRYLSHAYVHGRSPTKLSVPEKAGEYEVRYVTIRDTVLARTKVTVTGATATVEAPTTAVGGSTVSVKWKGPSNRFDRLGVVRAGAPEKTAPLTYAYLQRRSPTKVSLPDEAGEYEVRYVTGHDDATLASAKITVTAATASIEPATAQAGATFKAVWKGPANQFDHVAIAAKGSPDERWLKIRYVRRGQATALQAPMTPGEYELRYVTFRHTVLARAKLDVTPAKQEPGTLTVAMATPAVGASGAVEVILDASGSMLERIGKERRIDIAVQTLKSLTTGVIPAGTPFALRVFGRAAGECQSELELPLAPLDGAAVAAKISGLEAKRNARTAIAASLEAVAADLRSAKGERLVILVTDGEETCGGNPAAAIQKLSKGGVGVRVNIVGFAIDDAKLAATFRQWAEQGRGDYFEARDAAGLSGAFSSALKPAFDVIDAKKNVVASGFVGDPPLQLLPGKYTVKLKGGSGGTRTVTVRAKEAAEVKF